MMPPAVLVEISPTQAPAQYVAALVSSCTETIDKGRCVLASSGAPQEHMRAIAIVTWEGPDQLSAKIQVGITRGQQPQWFASTLQFQAVDDPLERWKTVGIAIRTLVGESEAASPPEQAEPPPKPRPVSPPSPTPPPAPALKWPLHQMALGAFAGPGLSSGPIQAGVWGKVGQGLGQTPFYASLSASYGYRPTEGSDVHVNWTAIGLGMGAWVVGMDWMTLRAQGDVAAEWVQASAQESTTLQNDRDGRLRVGLRASMWAQWPLSPTLGVVAGVEGSTWARSVNIQVAGETQGTSPAWAGRAMLGLYAYLP